VLILCWFQASALFLFSGRNLSSSFRIFLRNQKQNFILAAFKAKERRGASNHQGMLFLTSLLFLYWISSKNYSVPLANSVFLMDFSWTLQYLAEECAAVSSLRNTTSNLFLLIILENN